MRRMSDQDWMGWLMPIAASQCLRRDQMVEMISLKSLLNDISIRYSPYYCSLLSSLFLLQHPSQYCFRDNSTAFYICVNYELLSPFSLSIYSSYSSYSSHFTLLSYNAILITLLSSLILNCLSISYDDFQISLKDTFISYRFYTIFGTLGPTSIFLLLLVIFLI